jgi:hypothetical protein
MTRAYVPADLRAACETGRKYKLMGLIEGWLDDR